MTEFPAEDALEQRVPVLPEEDDPLPTDHGDDVDPAEAYVEDRPVPVDEDEWR